MRKKLTEDQQRDIVAKEFVKFILTCRRKTGIKDDFYPVYLVLMMGANILRSYMGSQDYYQMLREFNRILNKENIKSRMKFVWSKLSLIERNALFVLVKYRGII